MCWVRRTVGAQKETRITRGGCLEQSHTVRFALEHGQAVIVRANAARKDGIAVVEQVMRGERGADKAIG